MPSATYPTKQPITNAGIEAFLASIAPPPRTARVKIRVKQFTPAVCAAIVERMAHDMRMFGDGMTEDDLKRAGYSQDEIFHCAKNARDLAMRQSRLQ